MKIEWLVTNMTSVKSHASAEYAIFGGILDFLWPIQAVIVIGEPLCDVEIPS